MKPANSNLGFPFNISAMAGASDFKFCLPLGFATAHHKITPTGMGIRMRRPFWTPY